MKLRTHFVRAVGAVVETLESRRLMSSISGIVFSDSNTDGALDAADTVLPNRRMFIDLDTDGVRDSSEPTIMSNASGLFTFDGLSAGTYRVRRADVPVGYKLSTPASGFVDVTIAADQNVDSINFGAVPNSAPTGTNNPGPSTGVGSIAGVIFSDTDTDGLLDATDTCLANRKMYLDLDKDGVKDSNEPTATSNASGEYTFADLSAGVYVRRADLPAGYTHSTPTDGYLDLNVVAGQTLSGNNFGAIPTSSSGGNTGGTTGGSGKTYYVSGSGSDSAAGTSSSSAWKSINRVNSQQIKPGDSILFASGQSFSGSLYFPSAEGGTKTSPVTIGIFGGTSRTTIKSGIASGIDIAQTAGFVISDLNFVGSGMTSNTAAGIWVHVDFASKTLSRLEVKNVDVSGYGREGMRIAVGGAGSTLNDVKVENTIFHDNLYGGLKVTGSKQFSNKNYLVDHVQAYNSPGSEAAGGVTGSGIYLADVDGAIIRRSTAYNNGQSGAAPVGIWAAGSNKVTIEYCESYNNHTKTTTDGGGFDFDWDVTNSVMQYNYSHNNDGPGYILAAGDKVNSGNVLRYNVSENDGRKNGRAGMQLWGNVTNATIHNNTIYISSTGSANTAAFYAHDAGSNGKRPQNVSVANNIFYTTNGAKIVNLTSGVASYGSLKFNGNAYHTTSGNFTIQWGSTAYNSLSSWQAGKGQEMLLGTATGFQGDPKLMAAGTGGTIGNTDNLRSLSAYKLQTGSPLINTGVAPPTFLASSLTDFYGDTLPKGGKYDIGVDEVA